MVFKNESQLKSFLLAKCKSAITMAQDQVYQIIDDYMQMFYADYSPDPSRGGYERTYQLMRSLVKTEVISTGNGYTAFVFFDIDGLRYETGGRPSMQQVMDAAEQGLHGAIGDIPNSDKQFKYVHGKTGVDVWITPREVLKEEGYRILEEMLIANGVPVRRK